MEKTRKSYFKSLFKSVDVVIASFLGLVFACALYYVDHHNLLGRFSSFAMSNYILPLCKAGLVVCVVALLLYLVLTIKQKKIIRSDAVLFGTFVSSLGGLAATLINDCSKMMTILWSGTLAVSLILLIVRAIYFANNAEGESDVLPIKHYHALVARKYNPVIIYLVPAILGFLTLKFYSDIRGVVSKNMIVIAAGAIVAFCVLAFIATILRGKKTRVNVIDAVLNVLFVYVMFIGGLLLTTRRVRNDVIWAAGFGMLTLTLFVRSVFVSYNVPVELEKKGPRNYYGLVFEKFGASCPVLLGLAIGLLIDFCSLKSLRHVFDVKSTAIFASIIILLLAIAAVLFVIGLFKKGLFDNKVNLVDFVLLSGVVASTLASYVMIKYFTVGRILLVLVPFVVCAALTVLRIYKVDVVVPEPIEDDVISLKIRVTIDDDKIRAYCNDKEIAVVDNRTKVEEVVEEEPQEQEAIEEVVAQEPVEEPVEEVKEESTEELAEDNTIIEPIVTPEDILEDSNKLVIAKRSFENKIKFTSPKVKDYYSLIKNELLAYRTKSKISKKSESFRKKGLFAKLTVSGKSLRIHLPLDPANYDEGRYHQFDMGEKKAFKDVPFTMKIRSDLSCRRAIELIQEIANIRGLRRNSKYEPVNFAENLDVDGIAILEKVGELKSFTEVASKQDAEQLTDKVLDLIPVIKMPKALNEEVVNVYIDTALKYVENTISVETLREAQQIGSTIEVINIKARTGLDKKITIIGDEIDPTAAKLVILTGGKVFKIVRQ